MTWADEHLRAFIDRVLRLKEEQDNLGKDIREVYAEAKANGFDKTVLGQVVAYLRKREKDPHKVEESEAIFDIYLHSYNRGTSLATHTRESDDGDRPAHDPTTGELIDDVPGNGPATAPAPGAGGDTITAKGDAGENTAVTGCVLQDASPISSPAGREEGRAMPSSLGPLGEEANAIAPDAVSSLISQSGAPLTPDAPVEQSPSRDVAPGAPFPCEANGWAGLEPLPQFDRRRPAA